ncbi:MAG: hypothetical protein AAGL23_02190 [Pseudomonadota bacterium]
MGGIGSGNWCQKGKNLTTQYRNLDVRRWARDGLLEPGNTFGWQWSENGTPTASMRVQAKVGQVRLIYRSRENGGAWEDFDYPVRLLAQPCHLGGYREWFSCPVKGCGRRVALLYCGRIFACRQCHQLAYPSTRETNFQRAQRRADKLMERLQWIDDPDLMRGTKPKGMHWKTFNRLLDELAYWEHEANTGFAKSFLARYGDMIDWPLAMS